MPGSLSTSNGAITRRAAVGGTSGPCGVSSANTTAVIAVSAPLRPSARRTPLEVHGERQEQRREQAAERDRHLAHADREPAPLGREAVEHRDGRPDGDDRAGHAAGEERDAQPDRVRQQRADDQQEAAGGAREEQRHARPRAVDDDAGDDQRDGVAERRRVDERAEARRAEAVAAPAGRARSPRGPTARSRSTPGRRARGRAAGRDCAHVSAASLLERRSGQQGRAEQAPGEVRILLRRRELAQHGRRARQVRAGRARQVAADRIRQRPAPLAARELLGEGRDGAGVGRRRSRRSDRRRRPPAAANAARRRAARPRRCPPRRAGARAAAGPPGRPIRSRGTRRGRDRCRAARSRVERHLDTRDSRLAALLMRPPRPCVSDSGATGCLPRSHRFPDSRAVRRPRRRDSARGGRAPPARTPRRRPGRTACRRACAARRARRPCCGRRDRGGPRPSRRRRRRPR